MICESFISANTNNTGIKVELHPSLLSLSQSGAPGMSALLYIEIPCRSDPPSSPLVDPVD